MIHVNQFSSFNAQSLSISGVGLLKLVLHIPLFEPRAPTWSPRRTTDCYFRRFCSFWESNSYLCFYAPLLTIITQLRQNETSYSSRVSLQLLAEMKKHKHQRYISMKGKRWRSVNNFFPRTGYPLEFYLILWTIWVCLNYTEICGAHPWVGDLVRPEQYQSTDPGRMQDRLGRIRTLQLD